MSPHIIKAASGVNGHQQTQTDTPRHPWTMSGWKTHNFGTTLKGGNFFTWPFWDNKISKCPYKIFTKMVGFRQFGFFYARQIEIIKYSCTWSPCTSFKKRFNTQIWLKYVETLFHIEICVLYKRKGFRSDFSSEKTQRGKVKNATNMTMQRGIPKDTS